eukprot:TRINITY_DN9378_c0_g3_i1.p1 TRINITY_DN9378_c0_g3~~TRINITY_DN9378_c0_g3_i1.p1  ORF type:complete len:261 (+),score=62.83 TRINITY_DN9378_c0_g3_i1:91-873(+)
MIELEEQVLNDSEKQELLEIDTALTDWNRVKTAGSSKFEAILKEIEELVESSKGQGQYMQKECERRISRSLMELLRALEAQNKDEFIDIPTLMHISELARKYLQGKPQIQLLSVILKEYRRLQERSLNEQETERKSIETAEKFANQYKMLNELLNLFPKANSQEKTIRKKSTTLIEAKIKQPKAKCTKEIKKQKPIQQKPSYTTPKRIVYKSNTKTHRGKQNKQKNATARKSEKELDDGWIGSKNIELEDDSVWQKTSLV